MGEVMRIGVGPLSEGVAVAALLVLTAVLVVLARKDRHRGARGSLAFCAAAAFLLALSHAMAGRGIQPPAFKLLAELGGLASVLLYLAKLPQWLAAPTLPESLAMMEEKDSALGRLQESPTNLGGLVEEVKEYAIFHLDAQGRVTSWNLGAERIKGWRAEEILGQPNAVFYPEEEIRAGKPEQDLEQARTMGSLHQEGWRIRKDGSRFFASLVHTAIHDAEGQVTGFTKITHDITERREAEERLKALARDLEAQMSIRTGELQESEARLQGFIQHACAAIAFKGLDGRLLLVNQRAAALLGINQAAVPGLSPEEIFPLEMAAKSREQDERVLTHREEILAEMPVTLLDGSIRDLLVQKFPLIDARGHCWGLGVIATDITERKLIERDHLQRQKLESLGLLSGGIAHDFNNLLGAMVGNVELFRSELDPNGQEVTRLKALEDLIGRASNLVAQILAYAGKGKFKVQPLDLNFQVEDIIRLLRASLFRNAAVQWQPAPDLPAVEGDLAQIQQVIMNLIINALEAVPVQEGVIIIRTGSEAITGTDAENQPPGMALKPGPYLTFEVSDNGPGMPPEVQERIFDPFFTTKFTGRGLGLSVVQGILRSHQGGIRVTSKVGEGTTFKLFFPAAPASAKAEPMAPPAPGIQGTDFKGTGTILVVDDEEALRSVAVAAIRRLGFHTLEARDGLEALQAFEANQARICLVLMDLTMPRMDGEEAYREFRRAGSMVPIILSSGFGQEEAFQRFRGRGLAGFLPKPYHFQDLVSTIRAALEGRDGNPMPPGDLGGGRVAWASEFETGHPLIDGQHQEILKAFNHLVAVSGRGNRPKNLDQAFAQLMDATIAHFGVEEGLMAEAAYPDARAHQAVHALLLRQIRDVAQKIRIGATPLAPPVIHFLEDWLVCHMQYEDMHLARYLKTAGH